jgi:hypothetical protein
MTTKSILVDLTVVPSYCNAWPELEIQANGQTVWKDQVTETSVISFGFDTEPNNQIRINYINKRNGPDVWDTQIDQAGQIVQDQYAILTRVRINHAQCDWIIDDLLWHYLDGTQRANRGFMDLQGHADIEFPADVYGWIVQQRQSRAEITDKTSALDYKNIYIPSHTNQQACDLLDEIKQMVNNIRV